MGNKTSLSLPEREFYSQVKIFLVGEHFAFRRVVLKHFVKWIFVNFPDVNLSLVYSGAFWDTVGQKLTVTQLRGDLSVAKFFPLFQLIIKAVDKAGKVAGPQLKPCTPRSPPRVPKPSSPAEGGSAGALPTSVPEGHRPSGTFLPPLYPPQDGTGHMDLRLPCNLLPMPTYPVLPLPKVSSFPISNALQDSASNEAGPIILPPPYPCFPASHPQNGGCPGSEAPAVGGAIGVAPPSSIPQTCSSVAPPPVPSHTPLTMPPKEATPPGPATPPDETTPTQDRKTPPQTPPTACA